MRRTRFAVDLITFFDPHFWGRTSEQEVVAYGMAEPRAFWDRMLDALEGSGVSGIEITFAPFDWRTAVRAYGSGDAFDAALKRRGLCLATGFFANVATGGDLTDMSVQAAHLERAEQYADFLASVGVDVMVMGLPMRRSWDQQPPHFIDLDYGRQVADFCHRLGDTTLRRGVQLALHPEAHSMFCTARDIDLLLLLTDPVYVGFCPDTAHILLAGSDPVDVVARHGARLLATHWKDATGRGPLRTPIDAAIHTRHRPYFCPLGAGRVDWNAWTALLDRIAFDGWSILEIDAVPDPVAAIAQSMDFVRGQPG